MLAWQHGSVSTLISVRSISVNGSRRIRNNVVKSSRQMMPSIIAVKTIFYREHRVLYDQLRQQAILELLAEDQEMGESISYIRGPDAASGKNCTVCGAVVKSPTGHHTCSQECLTETIANKLLKCARRSSQSPSRTLHPRP